MFYPFAERNKDILPHDPFKAIIAPRPIGWISSVSSQGHINLAPYSFFNALANSPPILAFCSGEKKDSVSFIEETGEFTWSLSTHDLRFEMNATGASLPRGHNEFEHAGLEMAQSKLVKPPRVARAPAAMECKLIEIKHLRDMHGNLTENYLVIGQVVGIYINDDFILDGRFDTAKAAPLARCGYSDYSAASDLFSVQRPK